MKGCVAQPVRQFAPAQHHRHRRDEDDGEQAVAQEARDPVELSALRRRFGCVTQTGVMQGEKTRAGVVTARACDGGAMRLTILWITTMNTTDHPRMYPKFTFPIWVRRRVGEGGDAPSTRGEAQGVRDAREASVRRGGARGVCRRGGEGAQAAGTFRGGTQTPAGPAKAAGQAPRRLSGLLGRRSGAELAQKAPVEPVARVCPWRRGGWDSFGPAREGAGVWMFPTIRRLTPISPSSISLGSSLMGLRTPFVFRRMYGMSIPSSEGSEEQGKGVQAQDESL